MTPKSHSILFLAAWLVFMAALLGGELLMTRHAVQRELEHELTLLKEHLAGELRTQRTAVTALHAFLTGAGTVDAMAVSQFSRQLVGGSTGSWTIGVAEGVARGDRHGTGEHLHGEGVEGSPPGSASGGQTLAATAGHPRELAYPVTVHASPPTARRDWTGLDVYGIPQLRAAIDLARRTDGIARSQPFRLAEDAEAFAAIKAVDLGRAAAPRLPEDLPDALVILVAPTSSLVPPGLEAPGFSLTLRMAPADALPGEGPTTLFATPVNRVSGLETALLPVIAHGTVLMAGDTAFSLLAQRQLGLRDIGGWHFWTLAILSLLLLAAAVGHARSQAPLEEVRRDRDQALRALARPNVADEIDDYFARCVEKLAATYHSSYAFIGLLTDETRSRVRTVAFWNRGRLAENFEYDLAGTPCADVFAQSTALIRNDAASAFPQDRMLARMGIESYFGASVMGDDGLPIGLVSVMDTRPLQLSSSTEPILGLFSERISAEYARYRADTALQALTRDLERQVAERTEEYRRSKEEAEEANRAKSLFLTKMSHELRTPLNAILGFAQVMDTDERQPLADAHRESVSQILASGWHLLGMVNDVLDLAAIEAGRLEVHPQPLPLAAQIHEALDMMAPLAARRRVTITLDGGDCSARWVQADPVRLRQVLLNLLSNAVKYNREAGRVTVRCRPGDGEQIRVEVSDTGPGLPVQDLETIFKPFSRRYLEGYALEGTGIGLSISRHLVERMGGTMGVESVPGDGATFWLEVPGAEAPTDTGHLAPRPVAAEEAAEQTVLYVEDSPSHLKLMESVFKGMGRIRLLTAHNAALGRDMALVHRPDLILLDISLPEVDGFALLEELQAHEETRAVPVVAVSANAMPQEVERGLAAGFRRYLTKPIDINAFKQVVAELLQDRAA